MSFVMEVQTTRLLLQNASTFIKKEIRCFGWPAIHTEKAKRKKPKCNLFIDIGCETKERVDKWRSCRMRHHPDEFMIQMI
jgi:hypothetical protein